MLDKADAVNRRPLVFGEVLFDHFPDGTSVLGGAPFNVAWHLQGFGLAPLFISRVGVDARGDEVLDAMSDWGLDITGVQRHVERPTGKVSITLDEGQPTFDILADQAYDQVDPERAVKAAGNDKFGLLYHGSLALRDKVSRTALAHLRAATEAPIFLDVNLREPWFDHDTVGAALDGARWAKLNDAELAELSPVEGDVETMASALATQHDLEAVVATLGADGAVWVDREGIVASAQPARSTDIVDTVGAGDAFASVCITGLFHDWSPERILRSAHGFAVQICAIRGATARNPMLYERAK